MRIRAGSAVWLAAALATLPSAAQTPPILTLEQAEKLAVQNHPRIAAAGLNAQASAATVVQVRSAFQPQLFGNVTTVGADRDTSIAAGTLQTSGLASRAATGLGVSQLVTDFGRTANLTEAAKLRAAAVDRNVTTTRAQVLLAVDQAYYAILASEAVLKVAQARLEMQRLTLRQVRALAQSSLRSTLDVSFAEVAVSEAELALYQAENAAKASRATLAGALGDARVTGYEVIDVPLPGPVADDAETLVSEAMKNRPELAVARISQSAAERFAEAEKRLRYPAVSIVAVAGAVPVHQSHFAGQYSGAGLNVTIPFLNGGLNAARRNEAEFRARSADREVDALSVQVATGVRVAWFEADTAWRRIDVTTRLVEQSATALRLAKARYDIGLSGIIELTQAQLAQISAQIAAANAKYDYLTRIASLNYAIGAFR